MRRAVPTLLVAFAVMNAALYSALLPLWEGFDEAWHYAYVDSLAASGRIPILGEARLTTEIANSLKQTPVSHVVQHDWPELQTFSQYFALIPAERAAEIASRNAIPHDVNKADRTNYEAQQPPLAYATLAVPDLILCNSRLAARVLWLRMFAALLAVWITYSGGKVLFRELEIPFPFAELAMFSLFACQMYWAAVAHIANDWLGVALSVWFFAAVCRFASAPLRRHVLILAAVTAIGLLTKAYFLPLAAVALVEVAWTRVRTVPVFVAVVGAIAGPWYARNVFLYGNFSGLIMTTKGLRISDSLRNAGHVDWMQAIPYMMRATLWTGNNSFLSFSQTTLDVLIVLLFIGIVLCVRVLHGRMSWLLASLVVYGIAIIWVTANDVELLQGRSAGAAPWYTIVLLPPLLALSFAGMSRMRRLGRALALTTASLFLYILAATYIIKLIPLYSGFPEGRNTLSKTFRWYISEPSWKQNLSLTSLAPWWVLLTGVVSVLLLGALVLIVSGSAAGMVRAHANRL